MTDKKSIESRRKLLKSIAAGSGVIVAGKSLPESWSKPVLDSVMLPTHAQTSGRIYSGDLSLRAANDEQMDSLLAGLSNTFISKAHAGVDLPAIAIGCAIEIGSVFDVWFQIGDSDATLSEITGILPYPGTAQLKQVSLCDSMNDSIPSSIVALMDEYIDIDLGEGVVRLLKNDMCVSKLIPDCTPVISDMRLKTNIEALSISRKGYNLYKFQYIDENTEDTYVGVMAQDIISRNPEAIVQNESGFYMVRYDQLGLKMVTLKQWEDEGPDSVELMH